MNGYGIMCFSILMKLTTSGIYSQVPSKGTYQSVTMQWYCYCFALHLMSSENECDTPAQEDIKQLCGDLCKLEGKMQSSDFLDFVVSEVEYGAGCHYITSLRNIF